MPDDPLLREHLEAQASHLADLRQADRELTTQKFVEIRTDLAARAEALVLRNEEVERRLHDLNGEAQRLRNIQAEYWPREAAESYIKEQARAAESLAKQIGEVREALEKSTAETTKRLEEQIRELRDSERTSGGQRLGSSELATRLFTAAAIGVAILALFLNHT
jgi:hypothetical protein